MSAAAAISSQRHSVGGRILLLALLTLGACRKPEDGRHGERKGPLVVAEQPPLPEDPERGQRSTAQWSQHLQHEEDERQGIFDRQRIPQHRALMKLLTNARKTLDEAKGWQELGQAQASVRKQLSEGRAQLKALDPWGNSSRLLSDYEALMKSLETRYPEARLAAYRGDSQPLTAARADFDAHLRSMNGWLTRLEDEDGEGEEHG